MFLLNLKISFDNLIHRLIINFRSMDYFKYILLFCLILFPITSKSYALTNSWCSNGKYDRAISPFPKRNFNKCPAYAKVIMTKKEVKDYYLNGL